MLRSAKNLNGKCKGKSSDGSEVIALFDEDKLSLKYLKAAHINIFKGTYTMGQTLYFQIYKRELIKNKQSHIHPINIKRQYELLSIGKKELRVMYKAEVIALER